MSVNILYIYIYLFISITIKSIISVNLRISNKIDINVDESNSINTTIEKLTATNPYKTNNKLLSEYTKDPDIFLKSHNNTEIFIAMFSNQTQGILNGHKLYDQFIKSKYKDDIQTKIDKMNNIENSNEKWAFNPLKKQFKLTENSKYNIIK